MTYAGDWKWSNYRATAGLAPAPNWLETGWTLARFDPRDKGQAREGYRRFVADARGASYKPWESLIGQIYLGGEAFCEMIQTMISSQPRSRAHPRAQLQPACLTSSLLRGRIAARLLRCARSGSST